MSPAKAWPWVLAALAALLALGVLALVLTEGGIHLG